MKKDLYSPKRAAKGVTIGLLVFGVFVMAFLAGCATPDYTVVTVAEHPDNPGSAAVAVGDLDTSGSIDPPGGNDGSGRAQCK